MSLGSNVASEGMLEKPQFSIFYGILVLISDILSLFLIYTVLKKSTADMKLYKIMLLKLAICDLFFNVAIAFLVSPDLLCPLSAVAVRSPIGGVSEMHAFITISIAVSIAVTVLTSINDCCFIRVCLFYQWNGLLKKLFSWRGVLFLLLINGITSVVIVSALWFAANTNDEFMKVVIADNMTHALGDYAFRPETVYFYIDIWRPQVVPLLSFVVFIFATFQIFNLCASRSIWRGIGIRKKNMSDKSYQSHRQFTLLVISQNLLPVLALSVPVILIAYSFAMRYEPDTFAEPIKHFVTFIVAVYPALSVFLSFIFIKPYKKFLFSILCTRSIRQMKKNQVSDMRMGKKNSEGDNEVFDSIGYI